ncbi:MAG: HAD family hydrolase [Roseovarius sp.]
MTPRRRLVVFDVDGTLVDSQAEIVAAMGHAFVRAGLSVPARAEILEVVGLSLEIAVARLAPQAAAELRCAMVAWYKDAYAARRAAPGAARAAPLYPHVPQVLAQLRARPGTLLGVATGKSRRGLDALWQTHALAGHFATEQVSDRHPSKPHPAMLEAALAETGVAPGDAVMVGDTSFDMEMAAAAGVPFVGVGWGYHPPRRLHAAVAVLEDFRALPKVLDALWGAAAA